METFLAFLSVAWYSVIVPFVLPGVIAIVGLRARAYFNTKIASENIRNMLNIAIIATEATEKEYVDQIKKASEDGILTDDEKKQAQSMAIDRFKSIALSEIGKQITNEDAKTFIESALKLTGRSLQFGSL